MTSIFALAVVGSWTYAGFLAEPKPAPPQPAPASAPTRPALPVIDPEPTAKPEPKPEPESNPKPEPTVPAILPAEKSVPISPAVQMYRSADAAGQVWEHSDPNYLRSFVEARNRSFATPSFTKAAPYRASRCFNGRCK